MKSTINLDNEIDSDFSEDEWVINSINEVPPPPLSHSTSKKRYHNKTKKNRQSPMISEASIRMIKANLPSRRKRTKSPLLHPNGRDYSSTIQAAAAAATASPPFLLTSPSMSPSSPASTITIMTTPPTIVSSIGTSSLVTDETDTETESEKDKAASLQYISDQELQSICTDMNAELLISRLIHVYKSCDIYLRIREIETINSVIEVRLRKYLHYSSDPPDFVLNTLEALSNYFANHSKNKELTSKFRKMLVNNLCTALRKFLDTPIEQRCLPEKTEMDLISFDDDVVQQVTHSMDLISFEDPVDNNHVEEDEDDNDDDEDEDEEEDNIITLAEILGVPEEIIQRYTLTRRHQLKLLKMMDTIPSPVIVYYAMDTFKLSDLIALGCELEDEGVKLARTLFKYGYYDEVVSIIRHLNLFDRFPIDYTADLFFTAGHGMHLPLLYRDHAERQRQLLCFINKQLRFNYAGNLGIVPDTYLKDPLETDTPIQQLSRLKERKFQKDLVNCGTKIMKEIELKEESESEYYFISLSQRYACLRYILAQRAIQQLEDDTMTIEASDNYNGLIDLLCERDPVMARLAIKELIDIGDTVAPPYFASRYGQQEFYCRYNSLPLDQRLLGVVKGEQMSRHRTTFTSCKRGPHHGHAMLSPEQYYYLPPYAKCVLVDSQETLMQMKEVLSVSTICGLDTEWIPHFAKISSSSVRTALMQIATDTDGYVFLLDLKTIFEPQNRHLYRLTELILKLLFEDEDILKLGFDFGGDLDLLHLSLPSSKDWQITKLIDMKTLKTKQGEVITGGLAGVVTTFLGVYLNKRQQLSNWERRPLSKEQILYGACDAFCLLDIYHVLCQWNHPFVEGLPNKKKSTGTFTCNSQFMRKIPGIYIDMLQCQITSPNKKKIYPINNNRLYIATDDNKRRKGLLNVIDRIIRI
ncbi:uncharacterized protein BX663DRAFT_545437 [Cokeromyces recurvatus]|uniref:uncharacterized protein n=1 Tax=Cokeromyces recurvatus TaxID=90255 RepID=UPI00221F9C3F|nr:uncharacterized protein BX663DRAFT_545437 [Cokeromyces recurvatus]KAI7899730.1 hypothetical protein BX663DRAFT_545437 [Cokeromyces recurvatus]